MRLIIFFIFFFPQMVFSNIIQHNYRFVHLTIQDGIGSHYVTDIHQDKKGFIWICTSNGLNRYDGHNFKIFRNEPDNKNSLSHSSTNSIAETKDGVLWIATINGLNRFDPQTERIQRFFNDTHHRIPNICLSNADILWIATRDQGVIRFNTKTFDYHYIQKDPKKQSNTLSSNTIQTLHIDKQNYLWIATINGLDRYDPETQTFVNFKNDPDDKKSLYINRVTAIFEDSSGSL